MELLQLEYFRVVAKREHMTKAAEELRIAQPALSKTIARLEEDLGVPLFDRHGRQIRLNEFGKAFLSKVELSLSLLEEGRMEVAEMAGEEKGSIHLATSTMDRLSEPLGEFVSRHPDVRFRITQASTDEMQRMVETGDVDVIVTPFPFEKPGLSGVAVFREDIYLGVPLGHRLAGRDSVRLEEVADEPFVGYKEGVPFQQMNELLLRKAGFEPRFVCRVDEPQAISSLVQAGLGVALVGNCGGPTTKLKKLPIESPECARTYRIVWNDSRYLSLAARRFRDFLVDYFANPGDASMKKSPPVGMPAGSPQRPSVIRRSRAAT
ncbi:LysR family transcriptional regulator [Paenibacillaceae bacterium WGS1546]|uniref:LysR family transcriptional regulator n=1 Tax=Cohnella sp. WGS1546 TaxID=3366810 RepID=UPI00372CF078